MYLRLHSQLPLVMLSLKYIYEVKLNKGFLNLQVLNKLTWEQAKLSRLVNTQFSHHISAVQYILT